MLVAQLDQVPCVASRTLDRKAAYICPVCRTKVTLKAGEQNIPHFAHQKKATCIQSEPETLEHLAGKLLLQQFFPQFDLEVYLPQLKQRPDLLWGQIALEFQCSPIAPERFIERTYGYLTQAYTPIWILGARLQPEYGLHRLQQACLRFDDQKGFYLYGLDVSKQQFLTFAFLQWTYEADLSYQKLMTTLKRTQTKITYAKHSVKRESYRTYLTRQLAQRRPAFLRLQEKFYLVGAHLAYLPEWIYQPSEWGILFRHDMLWMRYLFTCYPDFVVWRAQLAKEAQIWRYPFLDQEQIMRAVYQECRRLAKK